MERHHRLRCFAIMLMVLGASSFSPSPQQQPNTAVALHMMNSDNSRLSHAMFMVESVQDTADYWTGHQNGRVLRSSANDDGTLKGAFVALGKEKSFALELTTKRRNKNFECGNCVAYIGVCSPLSQLQERRELGALLPGQKPTVLQLLDVFANEPNGISVRTLASAPPGSDPLASLCLRASASLDEVREFYTEMLGIRVKAEDDTTLCLRYDGDETKNSRVATTLVFEKSSEPIVFGNCFDHLVVETASGIDEEYERIEKQGGVVFMKPTEMFGTKVMGVRDPNGYKIILAGVK